MSNLSEMEKVSKITGKGGGGIAIQGFPGSFHQLAAQSFFGKDAELVCCASFRELIFQAGNKQTCKAAVMAIENSIAGSILSNYSLIQKSDLKIVGEIYLQIKQNLLAPHGVSLSEIREVHSHPMALLQCLNYLEQHNWKLVETEDTALSAKHVSEGNNRHIAAIAGRLSADMFGLNILAADIQTEKDNYTRFLVLKRMADAEIPAGADKASLSFAIPHTRGSLASVLTIIAAEGASLTKLQSVPKPGSNWKYYFHVDIVFDEIESYKGLIYKLMTNTSELKVYGVYPSSYLK